MLPILGVLQMSPCPLTITNVSVLVSWDSGGAKDGSDNGGDTMNGRIFSGGFPLTHGDSLSTISPLAILLCLLPVMVDD